MARRAGAGANATGIAVTDGTGRALPGEDLVGRLRGVLAGATPAAPVADLHAKALQRRSRRLGRRRLA
ncbi:hypothetical protein [Paenirhodobacter sp.]|uniref:hypothetical protein n=1 Tax=Paenirhodobacter sp. TaxID=1965326 RepID=UPI003B3F9D2B